MLAMKVGIASVLAVVALMLAFGTAIADQTYHTDHLVVSLTSAGAAAGHPALRYGFVNNTHTEGPINFAIEDYLLNGAKPNTTYAVILSLQATDCSGAFSFSFANGATVVTDALGNGHSQANVSPEQVTAAGLHNTSFGIRWSFTANDVAAYVSECSNVHID
jgi:hypothetical protein